MFRIRQKDQIAIDLPGHQSELSYLVVAVVPVVVAVVVGTEVVLEEVAGLGHRIVGQRVSEDAEDDESEGRDDAGDGEAARGRKQP